MTEADGDIGRGYSFDQVEVGRSAEFQIEITERLHDSFSQLSGDMSPIHTDESFSGSTKFEHRIGYAFLLASFLSRLYGQYLPGGTSICIKQDLKFKKPFYIGDAIRVRGEVTNKVESTRFLYIKSTMTRQNGDVILEGEGIVWVVF